MLCDFSIQIDRSVLDQVDKYRLMSQKHFDTCSDVVNRILKIFFEEYEKQNDRS